jgi:hypothetical protein
MDEEIDYRRAFAEAQAEARQRVSNLVPAIPIRSADSLGTPYNEWLVAPTVPGVDGGGSSAPQEKHPFQIRIVGNRIQISPGTINQLLPQGYVGDLPLQGAGTAIVALRCTTNGAQVNLAEFVRLDTAPAAPLETLGAAPTQFYVVLGTVASSGAVQQVVYSNLAARITIAKQVEKPSVPVGTSPWNNFYTWLVFETNQFFVV